MSETGKEANVGKKTGPPAAGRNKDGKEKEEKEHTMLQEQVSSTGYNRQRKWLFLESMSSNESHVIVEDTKSEFEESMAMSSFSQDSYQGSA